MDVQQHRSSLGVELPGSGKGRSDLIGLSDGDPHRTQSLRHLGVIAAHVGGSVQLSGSGVAPRVGRHTPIV